MSLTGPDWHLLLHKTSLQGMVAVQQELGGGTVARGIAASLGWSPLILFWVRE